LYEGGVPNARCVKAATATDGMEPDVPTSELSPLLPETKIPTVGIFPCPERGKTFKHRGSFINHRMIHNEKKFNCPVCGKTFSRRSNVRRHFKVIHKMSDKESVKTSKELIRETQDPNRFRRDRQIFKAPTPATQACPLPTVCQLTADTYGALSPFQSRGLHGDDDAFMSKQTDEVQGMIRENKMLRKLLSNIHSRNIHLQEAMLMDQSIRQMQDVLGVGVPPLPLPVAPLI